MPAAALALSTDPSSSSRLRFPSLASLPSLSSAYAAAPVSASARTPNAVPPVAAATTPMADLSAVADKGTPLPELMFFAPTIMRRDHCAILRRCCREVEMSPRGSHVCR
uniref:Uncharacterized protein n=1 Tax=Oryza glaberrima TaxID=4538 RepID=A0A679BDC8_ORYGL|nr:hypothetical protein [Oryza glaberrima]